jgi:hypothetical protein
LVDYAEGYRWKNPTIFLDLASSLLNSGTVVSGGTTEIGGAQENNDGRIQVRVGCCPFVVEKILGAWETPATRGDLSSYRGSR